jgi:hypothetical protein
MEFSMRTYFRYTALGVALMAGTSLAHAQTVFNGATFVAQEPVVAPAPAVVLTQPAPAVATVPMRTVETVRTVRSTTYPGQRIVSRHVVRSRTGDRVTTTVTTVRESVVAAPAITPAVQAITQPAYTEVVRAPRLYDVVTPSPGAPPAFVAQPGPGTTVLTAAPTYRYIYEPDRILVIDVNTGIAVQAIPR